METGELKTRRRSSKKTKKTFTLEADKYSNQRINTYQKEHYRKTGDKKSKRKILREVIEFYERHRHCEDSFNSSAATAVFKDGL